MQQIKNKRYWGAFIRRHAFWPIYEIVSDFTKEFEIEICYFDLFISQISYLHVGLIDSIK